MINRDLINNADQLAVSRAIMAVANGLQDHHPETQLLAAAAFFLIVSEATNVPAQDTFVAIKNLMSAERQHVSPQFNAARDYVKGELLK